MLYTLLVALAIVALVLFIADVAVGGGIVAVIAVVLLVWLLLGASRGRSRV
ncbi:MAG: hypothetical protein ITG02_06545 [Patulibacter sp.]|nr:hypothetical protein [Patulibacter sp.]